MEKRHVSKTVFAVALVVAMVIGFILVNTHFAVKAQTATSVSGIISSDATWTQANSPYTFTGNALVNSGVTLTIEPGVTVNLNGYYIMVNGTLRARGTSADRISFNDAGSISFTQSSTSWNEQTGSGSIIENANLDSAQIGMSAVSPKINSNTVMSISVAGSAVISNNSIINGINVNTDAESPIISYNIISGEFRVAYRSGSPLISHNTINNGITVDKDARSPTISYNTISGEVRTAAESTEISHNTIQGGVVLSGGSSIVSDNTIIGGEIGVNCAPGGPVGDVDAIILNNKITAVDIGVNLSPSLTTSLYGGRSNATISGNTISGCKTAGIHVGEDNVQGGHSAHGNIAVIEKNTVFNNYYGIEALAESSIEGNSITNNYYGVRGGNPIRYNTIADNSYGILGGSETLIYNNIQNNSKYSVHLGSAELGFYRTSDLNATYNWWGTTDTSTIKQSIFDFEEDFNLGTVNFVPFLAEPNPQAMPNASLPLPTPSPTSSPTPTLTSSPTPTQTPTQSTNPSPSPSQNPTASPAASQAELYGVAVVVLGVVVVVLVVVVVALMRKVSRFKSASVAA